MADLGFTEGATLVLAPPVNTRAKGPGRKAPFEPFYNPGMALNRDLSVLLVASHARALGRELDFADALAGTGARSLRIAREVAAPLVVHANDGDAGARQAIAAGRAANAVPAGRLEVTGDDARLFLARRRFDVVDLDPYGSPMPFLDAAVQATRPGGLLCATATDTGALCGTFPRVCRRRYGAEHHLRPAPWRAEVGLRILAGAVVRSAARADRAARPVLCVAHGHWMRVMARLDGARQDADGLLREMAYVHADPATGVGRFARQPPPADAGGRAAPWAGPAWAGPLHDATFVQALRMERPGRDVAQAKALDGLLPMLEAEAQEGSPAFWLVPDALQRALGPPPRRDELIARLQAAGHLAGRTHMDPQGVRTDAGLEALRAAWGPAPSGPPGSPGLPAHPAPASPTRPPSSRGPPFPAAPPRASAPP